MTPLAEVVLAAGGTLSASLFAVRQIVVDALRAMERERKADDEAWEAEVARLKKEEQAERRRTEPSGPPPKIYPFATYGLVGSGVGCPFCGIKTETGERMANRSATWICTNGPGLAQACTDDDCPARPQPHTHVHCATCKTTFFMAPKASDEGVS